MDIDTDMDFAWDESFDKDLFGEDTSVEKKENGSETPAETGELTDEEFLDLGDDDGERVEEPEESKEEIEGEEESGEGDDEEGADGNAHAADDSDEEDGEVFSSLYADLKEQGILSVDLEADEELNSTKFLEIFEKELGKRVEDEIEAFAGGFDDEAKAFIEFKKNGGSTVDFLKLYLNQSELPVDSVESVEDQERFMRHYLRTVEEMDSDEIDEEIDVYKERGQLEKKATKAFDKVSAEINRQKESELERQKAQKEAEDKSRMEFVGKLGTALKDNDVIGEFNITTSDKKELLDFIVKPTVKTGNRKMTGMQAKINEIYSDPEKLLLFAKLVKSDFDLSDIVKKAETKVTKKALSVVASKRKSGTPKVVSKGKYLADFFQ